MIIHRFKVGDRTVTMSGERRYDGFITCLTTISPRCALKDLSDSEMAEYEEGRNAFVRALIGGPWMVTP